jgi:hypothetical protein
MHMGSLFVLVSALPGKERELFDRLGALPGLKDRQHLFGDQIALRLDEAQLQVAQQALSLHGVREVRFYHDHDAWVLKPKGARAS